MPVNRVNRDIGDDINALYKRVGLLERRGRGFSIPAAGPGGGSIVAQDDPPPAPSDPNTLWIDTNDGNKIYRWNGSAWAPTMDPAVDLDRNAAATELAGWQDAAASGDGLVTLYRQAAAPTAGMAVGDLWVDSDDNKLYRWSGSAWGDLGSARLGALLAKPALASTVADGRVRTWWQYNEPTATGFGDVWVNTSTAPATLYRWNNYDWIQVLDWSVLDVQQQLESKITTFYEPAPPTSTAAGDLWYDTAHDNHPYRAESAGAAVIGAGQWVSVQDGAISDAASSAADAMDQANAALDAAAAAQATADGAITSYYLADPPWADGAPGHADDLGDLWYDTDTNQAYRWNGTAWVLIQDNAIAAAMAAASNAQTTADGKITAYYLNDPPWANGSLAHDQDFGDIWYELDKGNKPWYWASTRNWVALPIGTDAIQAGAVTEEKLDTGVTDTIDEALTTARSKVRVFREPAAPDPPLRPASEPAMAAGDFGDLWFDTTPGPGSAWPVSGRSLTSNVATLTTDNVHDINVGDTIQVVGVGAPFDGSFTASAVDVTAPGFSVSYPVASANVAFAAAAGTVTAQGVGDPANHAYIWDGTAWNDAQDAQVVQTTTSLNETSLAVRGHGEDITLLQSGQGTVQALAYAADGRISISDYTPMPEDAAGKNEGSLWITRTRDRLNLVTNPSFELGTTGWGVVRASITRATASTAPAGGYVGRVTNDATTTSGSHYATLSARPPAQAGQPVTLSAYARRISGTTTGHYVSMTFFDAAGVQLTGTGASVSGDPMDLPADGSWVRLFVSAVAPDNAATVSLRVQSPAANASAVWDFDAVLAEYSARLGRYFDGSSDGGSWVDAASPNNSASELDGGAVIRLFELADGVWTEKWWTKDTIASVYAGTVVGGPGYVRDPALPVNALDGGLLADNTVPVDKAYAQQVVCSEPVIAGQLVNVFDNNGLFMCRPASAYVRNQMPNPSVEVDTSLYVPLNATLSRSSAWAADGSWSLLITPTGAASDSHAHVGESGATPFRTGFQAGHTYTVSATIRMTAAHTGALDANRGRRIVVYSTVGGVSSYVASAPAPNAAGVTRLSLTTTIPDNATAAWARLYNGSNSPTDLVWWDAVQITESDSAMEYFEGATYREASGFVLDSAGAGDPVRVYHGGYDELLSGMAPGNQFLSNVPGEVSSSPPTEVGSLVQQVGFAAAPSVLNFSLSPSVLIV